MEHSVKLWLWKNFVDGRPEYWAFDNPYPTFMDSADPQTIGTPCGYALFKPSRNGRPDRSEAHVLDEIKNARQYPPQRKPWVGLTDEEREACVDWVISLETVTYSMTLVRVIEAKLKEKNT